jgi:hypothetical protein
MDGHMKIDNWDLKRESSPFQHRSPSPTDEIKNYKIQQKTTFTRNEHLY